MKTAEAVLYRIHPDLEEAAKSLGAKPGRSFYDVTLKLMLGGVISGATLSFLQIMTEISSTIILYRPPWKPMTAVIFENTTRAGSDFGVASAMTVILMLILCTAVRHYQEDQNEPEGRGKLCDLQLRITAGEGIDQVSKVFGKTRALNSVNLQIQPEEFFTIIGPSGCGKTTLLRHHIRLLRARWRQGIFQQSRRHQPAPWEAEHRFRIPELRPVAQYERVRERIYGLKIRKSPWITSNRR